MDLGVQRIAPVQQNMNTNYDYTSSSTNAMPEDVALERPVPANKSEAGKNGSQGEEHAQQELTKDETQQLTKQLNEFFRKINASLEFEIHEKTDRLIVKFVDKKENKVIKEFPPRELLDTLAAIQEYVGILLDKRV